LFNPATVEEDPDLFQCLSLFFPSYSFHSIQHQNNMVVAYSEATLAIFGSQKDTVLGIIDLQKYIDSMMFLTDPENCQSETVGYVMTLFLSFFLFLPFFYSLSFILIVFLSYP
jgi:hypothetical protein